MARAMVPWIVSALFLMACGRSVLDAGAGAGALRWYETCGLPLCLPPQDGGLTDDAGAPCPAIGTDCAVSGQTCGTSDPRVDCGAIEICAQADPTQRGCPR